MKKFTFLTLLIYLLIFGFANAQKVAVIGINHNSTSPNIDGFSFVALENIAVNEIIYFTENEYGGAGNDFIDQTEAVVKFIVTSAISKGSVVYVSETGTSTNTFNVSSNGDADKTVASGSFSLATGGEPMYAYSDIDDDPTNGITEVYSVMYTGEVSATPSTGGNIPSALNPVVHYPNAIVIDGFPANNPDRTEYKTSIADRTNVSKVMLENPTNYVHAQTQQSLSTTAFTNLNLSGSSPALTLSAAPVSVTENSGSAITYTFSLSENASSPLTVNFTVGGTAIYNTDYTSSGAASFNAASGTATINAGANSTSFTITPSGDTNLEPNETIIISISAGSGYDAGSPSTATGTIVNDDTAPVIPLVAVTGLNHTDNDGFSFVALDDIVGGTTIYFTENSFDNTALAFTGSEAVLSWTAPAAGIFKGDVIVAKETAANSFSLTGNGTSGAASGVITVISGSFSLASAGEGFFAYGDSDTNPLNGVDEVYSVLFTGTTVTSGGNIPAIENPAAVYIGAVVVDGFPSIAPDRVEYDPAKRNVTVDQADFQNTTNWNHAQTNQDLSPVPFNNIIISSGSPNPSATVTLSPSSVIEDSGTGLVYTFTLSAPASGSDIVVNFTVAGSAELTTDYTVSGATTYTASLGSVTILDGTSSAVVTITPVADTDVEVLESVELAISSGTGYDGGSPNDAIGTISNDDTTDSDPLVAVTGLNHTTADGFSFVAAKDIPASSVVYFTENEFDNTTLLFSSGEAVIKWISPSEVIPAGQVIVVSETGPNALGLSRSGGSTIYGAISVVTGDFAVATGGETFYAYEDDDDDPTNGVVDIYAVMYTGASASGGDIPPSEDPSGIYLSALVVDGFPATAPNRTEYDPTKRNVLVDAADFENTSNWLHAMANQTLSTVPFDDIAIVDIVPPTAVCQNITVYLDATGNITVAGADVDGGSSDDIGVSSFSLNPETFTCADIGTPVNAILTVKDAAGNEDNCTATITVLDTISPTAVCQDINAFLDASGNVTIAAADIDGGSSDNCGAPILSVSQTDFTCADIGVNNVTLTVADGSGNTSTCVAAVTVVDTLAPTTVCQNINVFLDGTGNGNIVAADIDGGSTDNCGAVTLGASQTAFTCADIGPNNVTLTVTDGNTNSANCIAVVTVIDTISPVAVCKDTTIYLTDASGITTITASELDDGSSDICGIATYTASQTSFSCADVGNPVNVILTVSDVSGNSSTCSSVVTVVDTKAPAPICINGLVANLDATGKTTIYPNDFIASPVIDNCGPVTYSFSEGLSQLDLTCADAGTKVVQIYATDVNGNSDYCETYVLVQDNLAPTAVCKDINAYLDETGNVSIVAADIDGGSSDNCSAVTLSIPPTSFTCADIGPNNVTLTVMDDNGNTATCVAIVTVVDAIPPIIICQNPYTLTLDASGQADIVPKLGEIITSVSDNCTVFGNTVDVGVTGPRYYTCNEVGDNSVTIFLTDDNGNRGSTTFTLKVVDPDSQAPTAICKNIEVMLDATGNASINAADLDNGSSDDCGAVTFSASQTQFTCDDIGANSVVLAVTDAGGLTATCNATVTLIDTITPNAVCQNINVYLDGAGNASIIAADIDGGSSDACGLASLSLDVTAFNGTMAGSNPVVLTVTDVSGNVSTCTSTVSVQDTIPPEVTCQNIGINLDPEGKARIYSAFVTEEASDAGGIVSSFLDISEFDCSDIGENTVVLSVKDVGGNISSCEATVTVYDNYPPEVVCQDIEVSLDAEGIAVIDSLMIDNGSSDLCGIATMELSKSIFTVGDLGENTVTLTVTGNGGNSSSCEATVTVKDDIAPVVNCNSISIWITDSATYELSDEDVLMLLSGSSDNVSSYDSLHIEVNPTMFSCSDVGDSVKVEVSVSDEAGNVSTCEAFVSVHYSFNTDIDDIEVILAAGICETAIDYPEVFVTESCASFTQLAGLGADALFPVGTSIETWEVAYDGVKDTVSFSVIVTSENALPTIDSISGVSGIEDTPLSVSISGISGGSDCVPQIVTISATAANTALVSQVEVVYTEGDTTGLLNLTLAADQNGMDSITVVVEDSEGAITSKMFVLTVAAVNDAPILVSPLEDQVIKANETLDYSFSKEMGVVFDDIDDLSLVYTYRTDDGMNHGWIVSTESSDMYTLTFTPSEADTGCYNIIVDAADAAGAMVSDTFEVCVQPIIVGIGELEINSMEVQMYPNPSKGFVNLGFSRMYVGEAELRVMNIAGQTVLHETYGSAQEIQFDLSENVSGLYMVTLEVEGKRVIKKLILDRE